jgi:hypothetical protein
MTEQDCKVTRRALAATVQSGSVRAAVSAQRSRGAPRVARLTT